MQPQRQARSRKAGIPDLFLTLDAQLEVIAVGVIIIIYPSVERVRRGDFAGKGDRLPRLRFQKGIPIIVYDRLEVRQIFRSDADVQAAVAAVFLRVIQHRAADLPRLPGVFLRAVYCETFVNEILQKAE